MRGAGVGDLEAPHLHARGDVVVVAVRIRDVAVAQIDVRDDLLARRQVDHVRARSTGEVDADARRERGAIGEVHVELVQFQIAVVDHERELVEATLVATDANRVAVTLVIDRLLAE
jgi:hypothetical protein